MGILVLKDYLTETNKTKQKQNNQTNRDKQICFLVHFITMWHFTRKNQKRLKKNSEFRPDNFFFFTERVHILKNV